MHLKARLNQLPRSALTTQFRVVALPSNAPIPSGLDIPAAEFRKILVFGIVMTGGPDAAEVLAENVHEAFGEQASIGADLPVSAAQNAGHFWSHWCPEEAGYGLFGDRAAALRTIRAEPALSPQPCRGRSRSILFSWTPACRRHCFPRRVSRLARAGGPERSGQPGAAAGDPLTPHGEMVARNALAVARVPAGNPNLRLLDCPVIPDGIPTFRSFLIPLPRPYIRCGHPSCGRAYWSPSRPAPAG